VCCCIHTLLTDLTPHRLFPTITFSSIYLLISLYPPPLSFHHTNITVTGKKWAPLRWWVYLLSILQKKLYQAHHHRHHHQLPPPPSWSPASFIFALLTSLIYFYFLSWRACNFAWTMNMMMMHCISLSLISWFVWIKHILFYALLPCHHIIANNSVSLSFCLLC